MSLNTQIQSYLNSQNIPFRTLHHEAASTSADSAAIRGTALASGAKALLIKGDKQFILCVISAARSLDSKKLRKALGVKKSRFASKDELFDMVGLVPGSVPPFGRPILDISLYVDQSILDQEEVAFNAGTLTDSIIMKGEDYRKVIEEMGEVVDVSSEAIQSIA